jgi:hypothetical protein
MMTMCTCLPPASQSGAVQRIPSGAPLPDWYPDKAPAHRQGSM